MRVQSKNPSLFRISDDELWLFPLNTFILKRRFWEHTNKEETIWRVSPLVAGGEDVPQSTSSQTSSLVHVTKTQHSRK